MIYVANALQLPGPDVDHPAWDTLLSLRNLDTVPVIARIRLCRDNGSLVLWTTPDGAVQDHCDVTLQPGLTWPASFIPGNGFSVQAGADALPPQNWQGAATIECLKVTPFGDENATDKVLAFFLLAFNDWHNGINAPYKKNYGVPGLTRKQLWQFAYAIPYFDDSEGDTQRIWTTGVEINNQGSTPATGTLVYTIAQTYAEKGQQFTIPFKVAPYEKKRFDLYLGNSDPDENQPGLKDVGYPDKLNSEGHVDIFTDQSALLQPSMLIADRQYDFTVTEEEAV